MVKEQSESPLEGAPAPPVARRDDPRMHTTEFAAYTSTHTQEFALPPAPPVTYPKAAALVGLGGALGALARYLLREALPATTTFTLVDLPWSTLIANILGCVILGSLTGAVAVRPWIRKELTLALGTGFCGGFTTMSTFTLETAAMIGGKYPYEALQYVMSNVILCAVAVAVGYYIARTVFNPNAPSSDADAVKIVEKEESL